MNTSQKSPSRPPVYEQLSIPVYIETDVMEISFINTLLLAHLGRVRSGSMGKAGRQQLLTILKNLSEIESILKE